MANRRSDLLAWNDHRLAAYLTATDEATRAAELERLLAGVQERVRSVLAGYVRTAWPVGPEDVDDIVSQVTVRLLRKMRAASVLEEESIQNLEAYTTTLAKNAMRDFMRRLSPERMRVKRRLRYLFARDSRLALWVVDGVTICGLGGWEHRLDVATPDMLARTLGRATAASADDAVAALAAIGAPVRLADLANACEPQETSTHLSEESEPDAASPIAAIEARQYLHVLWREIRDLPPNQRVALLLNLREPASGNAIVLFVSVGIATLSEIAEAVNMTIAQLGAVWDQLPLDDLRIASHLGVARQQVINMRKSARERLTRRMALRFRK